MRCAQPTSRLCPRRSLSLARRKPDAASTGTVAAGDAVRIFTGAPVPAGADTVVIQENTERSGERIRVLEVPRPGANVRLAGGDFRAGQTVLTAGHRLDAAAVTLIAAAGHAEVRVRRRPVVAILATGDELVEPGSGPPGPDQIVSSNSYGLAALVEQAGGRARLLGIAGDTHAALAAKLQDATGADILVTIGGASVGDRDLVRPALEARGLKLDFWKVAIRPGKPMLFGRLDEMRVLGLPGNPNSCLIAARVFLVPLICALLGRAGCAFRRADRHPRRRSRRQWPAPALHAGRARARLAASRARACLAG